MGRPRRSTCLIAAWITLCAAACSASLAGDDGADNRIGLLEQQIESRDLEGAKQTAGALNQSALVHLKAGRPAQAEAILRPLVPLCQPLFGPESSEVGQLWLNLAHACHRQDHYREAEAPYRRAIAIQETLLGPDDSRLAETLHGLANVYIKLYRDSEADELCQRVVKMLERSLGPEHPDVATALMTFT